MKTIIALSVVFVLFFQLTKVYGQENKVVLGVEAGPGLTWSHGSEGLEQQTDIAKRAFGGLSFQYNFSSVFSFHSGVTYEQKGHVMHFRATDNNGMSLGNVATHAKFSYLTVPVLLRTTFGKKVKYFLNAGPFVGYSLGHNVHLVFPDGRKTVEDHSEGFKPVDFGVSAGAGVSFPINSLLDLSLEVRNNLGLNDIDKMQPAEAGPFKTNSLNLVIGLSYKLEHVE